MVTITINGQKFIVPQGLTSFADLVSMANLPETTIQFTVVTPTSVTQAGTVHGNDSFTIIGGEVLTSA